MRKRTIIAIGGRAGAGKDSLAISLTKQLNDVGVDVNVATFARKLKEIARSLGWDGVKDEHGRKLLVDLGAAARAYNPYVFCTGLVEYLREIGGYLGDVLIIPDLRMYDEVVYLLGMKDYYTEFVEVQRPDGWESSAAMNSTEALEWKNAIRDKNINYLVCMNGGGLDKLDQWARTFVREYYVPHLLIGD